MTSTAPFEFGFTLPNGSRIVHGKGGGALVKDAFPSNLNIPSKMYVFNAGSKNDVETPTFRGPCGCLPFDTCTTPPRHVHLVVPPATPGLAPSATGQVEGGEQQHRFITERIFVPYGVGIVGLAGECYVIPP